MLKKIVIALLIFISCKAQHTDRSFPLLHHRLSIWKRDLVLHCPADLYRREFKDRLLNMYNCEEPDDLEWFSFDFHLHICHASSQSVKDYIKDRETKFLKNLRVVKDIILYRKELLPFPLILEEEDYALTIINRFQNDLMTNSFQQSLRRASLANSESSLPSTKLRAYPKIK